MRVGELWRIGFAALVTSVLTLPAGAQETGTLVLVVTGFESAQGHALVQLANSKEDYEADDQGFRVARRTPTDREITLKFEELPYGEYAIKIFHDENDNEELDIGWAGPEELYGFSNDARALMGPPGWDAAKFDLDQREKTVSIEVK